MSVDVHSYGCTTGATNTPVGPITCNGIKAFGGAFSLVVNP